MSETLPTDIDGPLPTVTFALDLGDEFHSINFNYANYIAHLRHLGFTDEAIAATHVHFERGVTGNDPEATTSTGNFNHATQLITVYTSTPGLTPNHELDKTLGHETHHWEMALARHEAPGNYEEYMSAYQRLHEQAQTANMFGAAALLGAAGMAAIGGVTHLPQMAEAGGLLLVAGAGILGFGHTREQQALEAYRNDPEEVSARQREADITTGAFVDAIRR